MHNISRATDSNFLCLEILIFHTYKIADSGFFINFLYQGSVKSTVSWVFEDLKFKISEGYDQNWSESSENLKQGQDKPLNPT